MLHRILLAGLVCLLSGAAVQAGPAKGKRLNIICIVTDDQARWSIGAYGNKESRTPNMDRLAREGALFKNAFTATPVCSPSRASYFTGRYGTQVKIADYLSPLEEAAGVGLPSDTLTWAEVLRRAGYRTGLVGKWHLGRQPQFHPTKHGFDYFCGFLGGGATPMNPLIEEDGKDQKLKGYGGDILTDRAISFVTKNKDGPFALCLHFREPHAPYAPVPEADAALFKTLDPTIPSFKGLDAKHVKGLTRDYYASVYSVDRNLGRLLKALEDLGILDDTIILFTSDHGYSIGHHGILHKGNGTWIIGGVTGPRRPNMFDVNLQVPLLIRWPRVVRPGTVVEPMVSNIDTFASVLGMLNVAASKEYKHEGMDFAPILRGEKAAWRSDVFAQYDLHNFGMAFMRSIRTQRWHLVRYHLGEHMDELYDLKTDQDELTNLIKDPGSQKIRAELEGRLLAWQRSIDDPILRITRPDKMK